MNRSVAARRVEARILERCIGAARHDLLAENQRDANVFELAGSAIRSTFPEEAAGLRLAAKRYFDVHAEERLDPAAVVRLRWIIDMPRLKDMLEARLRAEASVGR